MKKILLLLSFAIQTISEVKTTENNFSNECPLECHQEDGTIIRFKFCSCDSHEKGYPQWVELPDNHFVLVCNSQAKKELELLRSKQEEELNCELRNKFRHTNTKGTFCSIQ